MLIVSNRTHFSGLKDLIFVKIEWGLFWEMIFEWGNFHTKKIKNNQTKKIKVLSVFMLYLVIIDMFDTSE